MAFISMPMHRSSKDVDRGLIGKSLFYSECKENYNLKCNGIIEKVSRIEERFNDSLSEYENDYTLVLDEKELEDYVDKCVENGIVAIDTETEGLDYYKDRVVGFSLYTKGEKAIYCPLLHKNYVTGELIENQVSYESARKILSKLKEIKLVYHNAKFDILMIKHNIGVELPYYFDTSIASVLLNENEPHGLKYLYDKYLGKNTGEAKAFLDLFEDVPFDRVPLEYGYVYGARDAYITFKLYEYYADFLSKYSELNIRYNLQSVSDVFWNIEMPYIAVCIEMEENGIGFDIELQEELKAQYEGRLNTVKEKLYKELNKYSIKINEYRGNLGVFSDPINLSSPKQLSTLLYSVMGIKDIYDSSTSKDTLKAIGTDFTLTLLDYRSLEKQLNSFINALPEMVKPDGKIHANFKQLGAVTGRISCTSPNLQQQSSHNKDIRNMFVAEDGNVLISSDFSKQEPFIMSVMANDVDLQESFKNDEDVYSRLAAKAFNKTYEECLEFNPDGTLNKEGKERRSQAKTLLLGILYGRGKESIAKQLGTSLKRAEEIKESIFTAFPNIRGFVDDTDKMSEENGYVTTFFGRKRRKPSKTQAVNARIQGTAASMSKIAGLNICNNERLRELGFKLLVPIHDRLILN